MEQDRPESRMTRRELLAIGLGAGAAAVAAACAPTTPAAPATQAPAAAGAATPTPPKIAATPAQAARRLSDTLTMGRQVATRSIDPHMNTTIAHFMEPRQVYDALVAFDDKGERLVPQLATSWTRRVDPTTLWEPDFPGHRGPAPHQFLPDLPARFPAPTGTTGAWPGSGGGAITRP